MFSEWGLTVNPVPNKYFPDYDGIASGELHGTPVRFSYEVKYDIRASETGNIYLDIAALSHSKASILCICLNDPIDTVLMLPLEQALKYAQTHQNTRGGEFNEKSCLASKDEFIANLKPQILRAKNVCL